MTALNCSKYNGLQEEKVVANRKTPKSIGREVFSKQIEQWKSEHNAHTTKILKDIELTAEFYIGVKLFLM